MADQGAALDRENVTKIIRCSCGAELRNVDEEALIRDTQHHATGAHQLDLSNEQVRSMMEIER